MDDEPEVTPGESTELNSFAMVVGKPGSLRRRIAVRVLVALLAVLVTTAVQVQWNVAQAVVDWLGKGRLQYAGGVLNEDEAGMRLDIRWGKSASDDFLAGQFLSVMRAVGLEGELTARSQVGLLYKKTRLMPQGLVLLVVYPTGGEKARRHSIVRYHPDNNHADRFYRIDGSDLKGQEGIPQEEQREFHLRTAELLGEYAKLDHMNSYEEGLFRLFR